MSRGDCEATITPRPDAEVCEVAECNEEELLAHVAPDGRAEGRTLCPWHRAKYLREVYGQ